MVKNKKMILKKCNCNFKKRYNINALHRPSKLAIAEVASMSGGRDILYHNVATETDHTVVVLLVLIKQLYTSVMIHPLFGWSVCLSVRLLAHLSVRPSACLSVHLSVRWLFFPPVPPSVANFFRLSWSSVYDLVFTVHRKGVFCQP